MFQQDRARPVTVFELFGIFVFYGYVCEVLRHELYKTHLKCNIFDFLKTILFSLNLKNKTILSSKNSLFGNISPFGSNYIQHCLG